MGITKEEDIMSEEITIVDGSCDAQSYALIANTKTTQLALRPFLVTGAAKNRSGNTTDDTAIKLWFRLHLQNEGVPGDVGVPTYRTVKNWGIPVYETSKYWRNDVYLQVALAGQADEKYLTKKVTSGIDVVLENLVENIGLKVKLGDKSAIIDWMVGRLTNSIKQFGAQSEGKNKAALLSTPEFKVQETVKNS
jgi:hypothetical protein